MADLWRDSLHGVRYASSDDASAGDSGRGIALLAGLDPSRTIALVRALAPLRARVAADLASTLRIARELQPEFVLLGSALEGGDIAAVLDAFLGDVLLEVIPVIVLATHRDDASELKALRGGALAWLPSQYTTEALLARVRLALRMRHSAEDASGRGASPSP
jgi:DNA-binding response OmpR family regulator